MKAIVEGFGALLIFFSILLLFLCAGLLQWMWLDLRETWREWRASKEKHDAHR